MSPIGLVPQKGPKRIPITVQAVALYLFLGLALAFTLSLLVVLFNRSGLKKKVIKVEEDLTETRLAEVRGKETRVFASQKRLEVYESVLTSHRKNSLFFDFLEKRVHKAVFVNSIDLDTRYSKVILSGQTEGFGELHQQILIFEEESFIKKVLLSEVKFNNEGGVDFIIALEISPQVFKK